MTYAWPKGEKSNELPVNVKKVPASGPLLFPRPEVVAASPESLTKRGLMNAIGNEVMRFAQGD
jgi:hypothetical protein